MLRKPRSNLPVVSLAWPRGVMGPQPAPCDSSVGQLQAGCYASRQSANPPGQWQPGSRIGRLWAPGVPVGRTSGNSTDDQTQSQRVRVRGRGGEDPRRRPGHRPGLGRGRKAAHAQEPGQWVPIVPEGGAGSVPGEAGTTCSAEETGQVTHPTTFRQASSS